MKAITFTIAATAAAASYAVSGAAALGHPVPDAHWGTRGAIVDAAGAAAFAFTAIALTGLTPQIARTWFADWASRIAQLGLAGMTVESIASLLHGGNTLGPLFFGGLLLALGGLAGLAVAGLRADRHRWAAPAPALALLIGIAGGNHGGFLATGLCWLALAALANFEHAAPVPA
jgi:hypothetical protein